VFEERLSDWSFTHKVTGLIVQVFRHFGPNELQLLVPGLASFLKVYGSFEPELRQRFLDGDSKQLPDLIFPFILTLTLLARMDLLELLPEQIALVNLPGSRCIWRKSA
jgi:hypothetical protein